jgi:hypothetical protein
MTIHVCREAGVGEEIPTGQMRLVGILDQVEEETMEGRILSNHHQIGRRLSSLIAQDQSDLFGF